MSGFGWFVITFLLGASLERIYERRFSHQADRGERRMSWSYAAFHSLYIVIFLATAAEYFWQRREPSWPLVGLGLAMFGVGVAVRLTALQTLGRFWSLHLEIRPDHELITHGIYSRLRHPAYLAIMLEIISVPLVAHSFFTLALAAITFIPLLLWRWRREEREMIDKFGDRYRQYCRQVPAFLPWPGRRIPPPVGRS